MIYTDFTGFSECIAELVPPPKNYRFDSSEVFVNQIGNVVMLIPTNDRWQSLLTSLSLFTDDFLSEPIEALPITEAVSIDGIRKHPSSSKDKRNHHLIPDTVKVAYFH